MPGDKQRSTHDVGRDDGRGVIKLRRSTITAYAKRVAQLRKAAARELGVAEASDEVFVAWLVESRVGLKASTWRQYRAAAVYNLERLCENRPDNATGLRAMIRTLRATPPSAEKPAEARTSAKKAKRLSLADYGAIVLRAKLGRARDGDALRWYLHSALITGLRPIEWANTRLVATPKLGFDWAVVAPCAKHDEDRAHSEYRTLLFKELPANVVGDLKRWLKAVADSEAGAGYGKLREALESLMYRLTRAAFPLRKKHPTLYSPRHEAAARFKAAFIEIHSDREARLEGAAKVAALLGHATDVTASQHYARARRSGDVFPIPEPDPVEVARVRRKLAASNEKWEARRGSSEPANRRR